MLSTPDGGADLTPLMTWHEDRYGNVAERCQHPEESLSWPKLENLIVDENSDSMLQLSEQILHQQVLPLIDIACSDNMARRTPGTFEYRCNRVMLGEDQNHLWQSKDVIEVLQAESKEWQDIAVAVVAENEGFRAKAEAELQETRLNAKKLQDERDLLRSTQNTSRRNGQTNFCMIS